LDRYFADLVPTNPQEAATVRQFTKLYRQLLKRKPGTLSRADIRMKFEIRAELKRIWGNFEEGIGEFLRVAGADGIVEALDTGLLNLHRFEAGKTERFGGLTPEDQDRRQVEVFEDLFWEFFDLIAEAVADGTTHPLFDKVSGDLPRAGVDAGAVFPSESAVARRRLNVLASDFLQRLPLFEKATVQEILDVRRELDGPLVRFRGAVIYLSEDIRSAARDEDFPSDADTAFRKGVEPAIFDIEEAVQSHSSFRELLLRDARPEHVGAGLGVMLGSLAGLPDVVAVALGSGLTAAATGRGAYKEWGENRENIESNQMYFYYGARGRLATVDRALARVPPGHRRRSGVL
jgi:hypothetical protein